MTETPALINWALRLTPEGEQLAAWMQENGVIYTVQPAPKNSLVKPVARYFQACPDDAADLWRQYLESIEKRTA